MAIHRWLRKYRTVLLVTAGVLAVPVLALVFRSFLLVRNFEATRPVDAATLFDRNGDVVASLGGGTRVDVPLDRIPVELRRAILAIEDTQFYKHPGVDPIAIVRAFLANLRAGERVQGASTITQQLARTLFLTREKTAARKIQEIVLAFVLEARFSKNKILELYLNRIYLGSGAYGVEAAANTYFGKSVSELTLAESATIAGLPRAPSVYDPYRNPKLATKRRNRVLDRMDEVGFIKSGMVEQAKETPIRLARRRGGVAPYFADYVRDLLVDRLGANLVFKGGLRVHTTLDLSMQRAAQDALGRNQGAIVAVDPNTGEIRAMVGGRDFIESQFNRAVRAFRQPGSAFKPFVYAAALESGQQENSILQDIPRSFGDYQPENFHSEYWGTATMKHALALSLNSATVWLLDQIGVGRAIEMARRLGINNLVPQDRNLALALGGLTKGVTPLEMAGAFAPFANGGYRVAPKAIVRVVDARGRVWVDQSDVQRERVLDPTIAYQMTDMMRAVLTKGTAKSSGIGRPAAGKTGTTNDVINAWFVGYTPDLVASIYIGNDDRTPVAGGGGRLAAPTWAKFMTRALEKTPPRDFPIPDGIVTGIKVDIFSGLLADEGCMWVEEDAFIRGNEPTEFAPCATVAVPRFPAPPPQIQLPLFPTVPEQQPRTPGQEFPISPETPVDQPPAQTTPEPTPPGPGPSQGPRPTPSPGRRQPAPEAGQNIPETPAPLSTPGGQERDELNKPAVPQDKPTQDVPAPSEEPVPAAEAQSN